MSSRTNREVLIHALQNFEDEYDEDYITDYLACPYYNDDDCENHKNGIEYGSGFAWTEGCRECKQKWLFKEWEE